MSAHQGPEQGAVGKISGELFDKLFDPRHVGKLIFIITCVEIEKPDCSQTSLDQYCQGFGRSDRYSRAPKNDRETAQMSHTDNKFKRNADTYELIHSVSSSLIWAQVIAPNTTNHSQDNINCAS